MEVKPIPAFYCCYLLRSTVRHASLYVGSTPHPPRRLAQHNGKVQGGAVRTSRLTLRPWEMACIVHGFPSNIAALQFEWAWHNAHLTRHIPAHDRISIATTRTKVSARTGKTTRRPGRPRSSLIDKLSNLHVLLRAQYFSKWPLEVRFFAEDVHRTWQSWCQRVDTQLRGGIKVSLDLPHRENPEDSSEFSSAQRPVKRRRAELIGNGGVEGVDPTYARLLDVLEKGKMVLDDDDPVHCDICKDELDREVDLFNICPHGACQSLSHLTCLSKKFLGDSASELTPQGGDCPKCQKRMEWPDIVTEISLRTRGEKEITKLLGRKRRTKAATAADILESESEDDMADHLDGLTADDVVNEEGEEDGHDDDCMSVMSVDSQTTIASPRVKPARGDEERRPEKLEVVIEDSDDG